MQGDGVVPFLLLGAPLLVVICIYAWRHSEDERRFAAGLGSGFSPAGRRAAAALTAGIGVAAFLAGVSELAAR